MQDMLYYAHSGLRWLVVLMTFVALGWLILRLAQRKPYDDLTHRIVTIWSSLFGVQWALGILLFLVLGGFDLGYRWEHTLTMTLALVAAHIHFMVKRRPNNVRYNGALAGIAGTLLLIFIGVARLPQGWAFEIEIPGDEADITETDDEAALLTDSIVLVLDKPTS